MPRSAPCAVVQDSAEVTARVLRLVDKGVVAWVDDGDLDVWVETACVHGDSPGAVEMARAVRDRLAVAGVTVRAFA